MQKVKAQFAVETKNGVIQRVGKSVINPPKTCFKGGTVKWLPDKLKQKTN